MFADILAVFESYVAGDVLEDEFALGENGNSALDIFDQDAFIQLQREIYLSVQELTEREQQLLDTYDTIKPVLKFVELLQQQLRASRQKYHELDECYSNYRQTLKNLFVEAADLDDFTSQLSCLGG